MGQDDDVAGVLSATEPALLASQKISTKGRLGTEHSGGEWELEGENHCCGDFKNGGIEEEQSATKL